MSYGNRRNLHRQLNSVFDVVVVGGGSNGVAIARDAALRGLKVVLLEKVDFGYGTVSRSTRLIHGGLRYLELFDFGLVREGLQERAVLLRTAPHLVHPLAFFTPVYADSRVGVAKLRLGMWLYQLLSSDPSIPKHTFLDPDEASAAEPLLRSEGLRGAFIYYDGHVPMPERLCLEAAQQAAEHGGVMLNHVRAEKLERGDNDFRVTVRDMLTDDTHVVRGQVVINATGPWADEVNEQLLGRSEDALRRTKGIHVLVPKLSERAVVMLAASDGRLFFAVPWGEFTYIGTTDTDFDGDLDAVAAERDEVQYLLEETQRVFPGARLDEVYLATAGVRPLVRDPRARAEGKVSRKHRILDHAADGVPGYISVLGGKITNMRSVAEETVDLVVQRLGKSAKPCSTRIESFPGAIKGDVTVFERRLADEGSAGQRAGLSRETIRNLIQLYGATAADVVELAAEDPSLAEPIQAGGPDIWAQLVYGVRHEWVQTSADFLLRRTPLGLRPGLARDVAPEVARRLGAELGRSDAGIAADVADYERITAMLTGELVSFSNDGHER